MNRSAVIIAVCLALIVASVAWIFLRPESRSERARRATGWRMCTECDHEWYKDRSELIRESQNTPDGLGFNKCPKCGAWRGTSVIVCPNPQCGKHFTAVTAVEDADGNLSFPKQRVCPHCGHRLGSEPGDAQPGTGETE